jgi:hypothetical protein
MKALDPLLMTSLYNYDQYSSVLYLGAIYARKLIALLLLNDAGGSDMLVMAEPGLFVCSGLFFGCAQPM